MVKISTSKTQKQNKPTKKPRFWLRTGIPSNLNIFNIMESIISVVLDLFCVQFGKIQIPHRTQSLILSRSYSTQDLSQDLDFLRYMQRSVLGEVSSVTMRVDVDISGIDVHRCLNFLYILKTCTICRTRTSYCIPCLIHQYKALCNIYHCRYKQSGMSMCLLLHTSYH